MSLFVPKDNMDVQKYTRSLMYMPQCTETTAKETAHEESDECKKPIKMLSSSKK